MSYDHDRDVAATLERLYPPLIGGPGWEDVLDRLGWRGPATEAGPAPSAVRKWPVRRSLVAPLAAVLVVIVAAPGLAFSPRVRQLVGLATASDNRVFIAHVTGVFVHGPDTRPGTLVTVRFTVGQPGKPLGVGIPKGSIFEVLLTRRSGQFAPAHGSDGDYRATIRLGPGRGIGGIQVGAFMPGKGQKPINAGFWIPTVIEIGR